MKNIFSNRYVRYALFVLVGLLLGWVFFHSSTKDGVKKEDTATKGEATVWTCSMHPHIKMDKPGKCPICGMDLIPLGQSAESVDPRVIHLSKEAAQLANVQTTVVSSQKSEMTLRLYGKVQADERLLQSQVAHIPGRIERLMVSFTGESVRKGQTLAVIYSPELVTAQQELIEASRTKQAQPEIYQAARERLVQWKLTDKQIDAIVHSGKIKYNFEIIANTSGIVINRKVNDGDYLTQGAVLYEVADLSKVWVMFDAYESDIPFISKGDKVTFEVQALPGVKYSGNIVFIDPIVDPTTRVAKVRVEVNNQSGKLKPEMFVTGQLVAHLNQYKNKLVIPRSSVLWTGKRSVVYVKTSKNEPMFKLRNVEIGPMLGNSYVVLDGLTEGEEIVTQGTFSVDAAAQLEGKPSMMNMDGGEAPAGHGHGGMESMGQGNEMSSMKHDAGMPGMNHGDMGAKPMAGAAAKQATFKVSGLCEMCKERIETAAKSVKGVTFANWNMDTKKLTLKYTGSKEVVDAVHNAVARAGHDTEKKKADSKVYNSLPECCKYR